MRSDKVATMDSTCGLRDMRIACQASFRYGATRRSLEPPPRLDVLELFLALMSVHLRPDSAKDWLMATREHSGVKFECLKSA